MYTCTVCVYWDEMLSSEQLRYLSLKHLLYLPSDYVTPTHITNNMYMSTPVGSIQATSRDRSEPSPPSAGGAGSESSCLHLHLCRLLPSVSGAGAWGNPYCILAVLLCFNDCVEVHLSVKYNMYTHTCMWLSNISMLPSFASTVFHCSL